MLRAQSFINEITDEFLPKKTTVTAKTPGKPVKVLTVAHGGFIGEFLNVVKLLEGR